MTELINNENIVKFTKKFKYPIGISPILVLLELKDNGLLKQVELADRLGYTKGAMTSIANKLVTNQLAERVFDENDRRIIRLCITDKGKQALFEANKIGKEIHLDLFSALTNEEIQIYVALQQKILNRQD
ncbi:MarR family winged helix-turn-helix transcriptional regulator [Solibacillus daqui]|uniref:MarR family winged helix-turn-helix transcriptional regulator n=1 Tax=Solibacillus daqui TaxID=2912187 RepID=UPI0023662DAA|nr:MarR family transcriptional regulator [Solibacillus daqui]